MQFSMMKKFQEVFPLEKHSFNEEIKALDEMEFHAGGTTMLGDALERVEQNVSQNNIDA